MCKSYTNYGRQYIFENWSILMYWHLISWGPKMPEQYKYSQTYTFFGKQTVQGIASFLSCNCLSQFIGKWRNEIKFVFFTIFLHTARSEVQHHHMTSVVLIRDTGWWQYLKINKYINNVWFNFLKILYNIFLHPVIRVAQLPVTVTQWSQ